MNCIRSSVFDIFKVGPGPSSSHTIGPMRAANRFLESVADGGFDPAAGPFRVEIELFGSLALTGRGHGTDRAIAAGLLGERPESCDIALLESLGNEPKRVYRLPVPGLEVGFALDSIRFRTGKHSHAFSNTMLFRLRDGSGAERLSELWYSTGGGFIRREGDDELDESGDVPFRYRDLASFRLLTEKYRLAPLEILMRNEIALSGRSEPEIREKLAGLIQRMMQSVENGLNASGTLPGPIGLERRAAKVLANGSTGKVAEENFLVVIDAYSLAAAEENAAGHLVVTAPTSGSAGLLPGIITFLYRKRGVSIEKLCDGLMIAALIAFVARHNASISGAEVGCQGEIGVAAAMAAALLASVAGYGLDVIGCAAEIALEHHLGLSCDPVDGYVQIPCIERNAVGAVTAYNAYLIASVSDPDKQKVTYDEVLAAMLQTGRSMSADYKETSRGGLAVCTLCC